jgi:hypothetical protein
MFPLVPDPDISQRILNALKDIGVSQDDLDDNLVFTVDESIRFVKDYPMHSKVKTNRINFFSSPLLV